MGRGERQEHQVEDADSRRRDLEPDRLGQPGVRHHGDQQGRRQQLQDRTLRRRQARGRPVAARMEDLQRSTRRPERSCGSGRAVTGAPRTKRHTKSSQASSTPVTDGRRVVAVFGSAGVMIAWDFNGKELWRVDLGALDSGWFFDPAFQWGHSSSPIIYRNSVILQADVQKGSYIAAWDLATGKRSGRRSAPTRSPTWGTPTIARTADGRDVLVTNGTKVRGYDPATRASSCGRSGRTRRSRSARRWPATGSSIVTGGYPPVRPIYAIRPARRGRHLAAEGTGIEPVDRVEQHDRRHLHPDAAACTTGICSR